MPESSEELNAARRLESICALDVRIIEILNKGSAVATAIAEGKKSGNSMSKKEDFERTLRDYNRMVEEVNSKLRNEVKLLHDASNTQLQPLYIPVQASLLGKEKEDSIFEAVLRQGDQ